MPKVRTTIQAAARARGFTVIEMMVVVMVVLALVAIAVPWMLRARMRANEASAVASMRAIRVAEDMYRASFPEVGYTGNLTDLGSHGSTCESTGKTNACLITDSQLASGMKAGYTFEVLADGNTPARGYTLTATPLSMGNTGRCVFVADETGAIQKASSAGGGHFESAAPASAGNSCDPSS
jgi:type IV pilus assembly protein PilA